MVEQYSQDFNGQEIVSEMKFQWTKNNENKIIKWWVWGFSHTAHILCLVENEPEFKLRVTFLRRFLLEF